MSSTLERSESISLGKKRPQREAAMPMVPSAKKKLKADVEFEVECPKFLMEAWAKWPHGFLPALTFEVLRLILGRSL